MNEPLTFRTTVLWSGPNNTGIQVRDEIVMKLAAGKKPKVKVTLNNYTYRTSIAVMGGKFMIPVSAATRKAAKINGGDELDVSIQLDLAPREVELPLDFRQLLEADQIAWNFYQGLSYSNQLRYVLPIDQAKTEETRNRRMQKAVADLAAGIK